MLEPDTLLVRYGEIGTKSSPVRGKMSSVLRQRVEDTVRADQDGVKVRESPGRVVAEELEKAEEAAEKVSMLPGVSSVSPAEKTEASMDSLKEVSEDFSPGKSFAVDANTTETEIGSQEIEREIGASIQEKTGTEVDLDEPEEVLGLEVRGEEAFAYTTTLEGPDGFPVGSEGGLAALISGGIDSPVAAYEAMTRGSDVTPVYFYNQPYVAGDHLMRFRKVVERLENFHPSKKWNAYIVDMGKVNRKLQEVGRGRMVLHRRLMFEVAEEITRREGLNGIVTGESMGQKSSQTPENLEVTSSAVDIPVHRPLLSRSKPEITEEARKIGTYEFSSIDSGCRDISPDQPMTEASREEIDELWDRVGGEDLVRQALDATEKKQVSEL